MNERDVIEGARQSSAGAGLDRGVLDDIIGRIVEAAEPERIILFGSAVRGEMSGHSDAALLIVEDWV